MGGGWSHSRACERVWNDRGRRYRSPGLQILRGSSTTGRILHDQISNPTHVREDKFLRILRDAFRLNGVLQPMKIFLAVAAVLAWVFGGALLLAPAPSSTLPHAWY